MKREGNVEKEKHKTTLFQRELTELNEFEITQQNRNLGKIRQCNFNPWG